MARAKEPLQPPAAAHPLHPQAQALVELMSAPGASPQPAMELAAARTIAAGLARLVGPGPEIGSVSDAIVQGEDGAPIAARVYEPGAPRGEAQAAERGPRAPLGTALFLHGGGWALGDLDGSDALVRTLVRASRCRIVSLDYRLAPEHPFPAALQDAWAALRWTAASYGEPVAVIGESAGGNLAAVLAIMARDQGGPAIALQVLAYPVVDHVATRSYSEHETGGTLSAAQMRWFWDMYLPDVRARDDPSASPLQTVDLGDLPPAMVVIAGHDPLRDEGLAYAQRLTDAGVDVQLQHHRDQPHLFLTFIGKLDAAGAAAASIGRTLRAVMTVHSPNASLM